MGYLRYTPVKAFEVWLHWYDITIIHTYRKRRKFRGVKVSWFLNCGLEVKFRGFRGSRFIHQ